MDKNIGKNMSESLSGKYTQKRLTDTLITVSKRRISKTVEATGDMIGNKIADKITKVWNTSPKVKQKTGSLIEKYQKKYLYHLKKGNKLLMSLD